MFYFKNGGIEDLIQLLLSWKYLKYNSHSDSNCFTFTVEYPKFNLDKLHPLENKMSVCLTDELWSSVKDSEGRIMDYNYFCKVCLCVLAFSTLFLLVAHNNDILYVLCERIIHIHIIEESTTCVINCTHLCVV